MHDIEKMMPDLEKVIKGLELCLGSIDSAGCPEGCPYYEACQKYENYAVFQPVMRDALEALKAQEPQWIPFVKRALTEEEQKHHPDWCYILDGEVPEDEEEILLYRPWNNKVGYIIEMDTYCNNGDECYLDGAGDIENGMYWMPLPEPPKEE